MQLTQFHTHSDIHIRTYTFGITKGQNAGYSGKDVHNMISDEELYRQYLSGDETGLEELMRKYDNSLTLYITGYLHDIHEARTLEEEACGEI